jgi:hypothetical protein
MTGHKQLAKPKYRVTVSGSHDAPAVEPQFETFADAKLCCIETAKAFAASIRERFGAPEHSREVTVTHQSGGDDSAVFRVIISYPSLNLIETQIRMYTVCPVQLNAPDISDLTEHLARY